jgi:hypothetical protein
MSNLDRLDEQQRRALFFMPHCGIKGDTLSIPSRQAPQAPKKPSTLVKTREDQPYKSLTFKQSILA